jgi:2-amino-4-hydroxy-6-hydroxymethyldihydropteridine diphosphokinase
MILCYLGLGSNLHSPERQLRQAIVELRKLPRTVVTNVSNLYFSRPCGMRSQPPYCNMVIAINTLLPAKALLNQCHRIEKKHQRVRKTRWGARTLDIDLLLYGEHVINHADLIVPHPRMTQRDFVLTPMLEIAPKVALPSGEPIAAYLKDCQKYLYNP